MADDTLTGSFNAGPLSKEVTDFVYAAEIDDCAAIAEFLKKYKDSINKVNNLGQTALMQAARFGRKNAVKLLLEEGADLNATNGYGDAKTPLELARENDHPEVAAILEQWPEVLKQRWLHDTDCSNGLSRDLPVTPMIGPLPRLKPKA